MMPRLDEGDTPYRVGGAMPVRLNSKVYWVYDSHGGVQQATALQDAVRRKRT